jgi:hypothetical protein
LRARFWPITAKPISPTSAVGVSAISFLPSNHLWGRLNFHWGHIEILPAGNPNKKLGIESRGEIKEQEFLREGEGESPFKSFPVQRDEHLMMVLRHVLQNPIRAGLSSTVREWRWSSSQKAAACRSLTLG